MPSLRSLRSLPYSLLFKVAVSVAVFAMAGYFVWQRTHTPQALFERGKKYYEQKNYQEAMIQLENAVRKDPRHKEAGLLLSHVYAALGNPVAATAQLKALLEYYPYDRTVDLELGSLNRSKAPDRGRSLALSNCSLNLTYLSERYICDVE